MFEILSGGFMLAFVGYIVGLPFWVLMIGSAIWGYIVGRDLSKRITEKKKKTKKEVFEWVSKNKAIKLKTLL